MVLFNSTGYLSFLGRLQAQAQSGLYRMSQKTVHFNGLPCRLLDFSIVVLCLRNIFKSDTFSVNSFRQNSNQNLKISIFENS